MNAVRGRVCGGHIELDTALPEGAEVVVLTADSEEPFDLDEAQLSELETRMTAAELEHNILGKLDLPRRTQAMRLVRDAPWLVSAFDTAGTPELTRRTG
jgi:hypothetical protein